METINTPFGPIEIQVPELESLCVISPIEQYRLDLYHYIMNRKAQDPECEISVTEVITVPITIEANGKGFSPVDENHYPIVAMEVAAFNDLVYELNLSDTLDMESLSCDQSARAKGLMSKILMSQGKYQEAMEMAFKGAKMGDVFSLAILGVIYSEGHGIPVDKNKGKKFSLSAALYGNQHALCNVALDIVGDKNGDLNLAKTLFERAAYQGNLYAAHNLGVLLLESGNNDKDIDSGIMWLQYSLENGYELSATVLLKYFKYRHNLDAYKKVLEYGVKNDFTSCKIEKIFFDVKKEDESPFQWQK